MINNILLYPILAPLICSLAIFIIPKGLRRGIEALALLGSLISLILAVSLFHSNLYYSHAWLGLGVSFSLRLYHFSAFIVTAASAFGFLITLYSLSFMKGKETFKQFYAYFLITLSFANGAVLADNLLVMLFFWEGLLLALFGMISIGNAQAFKTAIKAFIIVGISDLCLMIGIVLTGYLSHTLMISQINLPLTGLGSIAFILLMIGAISKAGSMPFHSWIPDAALDAPLPFMALVPAAFEKLLGIYFLTRISLDMFRLNPSSGVSILLMTIGAITIILAVMMALIQKDYKRLLSYHAISQVGYMILGIGTAVPAGIIGGLFHMINNALYKSGLFLSAGAVEKQTGTTNLEDLGGLAAKMPVTFVCFVITAVSISGVPPFNGFFSKELIYDAALERNWIFYGVAVIGSFFTAASFLKLGHSAFLGKLNDKNKNTKEAPFIMLLPMIIIAFTCVLFGPYNYLPVNKLIQPILGIQNLHGDNFSGMPKNFVLVIITLIVLIGAVLNHRYGVKTKGSGLKAVDHIHYAPVLSTIYSLAEKRFFDPYDIGLKLVALIERIAWWVDRKLDWVYDNLSVGITFAFTNKLKRLHNGNYSTYLTWSLLGFVIVTVFLISGK